MFCSFHCIIAVLKIAMPLLSLILIASAAYAQQNTSARGDSSVSVSLRNKDSVHNVKDTSHNILKKYISQKKNVFDKVFHKAKDTSSYAVRIQKKDSIGHHPDSVIQTFKKNVQNEKKSIAKIFHFKKDTTASPDSLKKSLYDSLHKNNLTKNFSIPGFKRDSALKFSDSSIVNSAKTVVRNKWESLISTQMGLHKDSLRKGDSARRKNLPGSQYLVFKKAPFLSFNGGYISYGFSYRSNTDTPFVEKNLEQHQINSSVHIAVMGKLPLVVNSFIRRTNSPFFAPITDIQVLFDVPAYRSILQSNLRERLLTGAGDSLTKNLYSISKLKSANLLQWLNNLGNKDKLIDAHEIVNVPQKGYEPGLPDSTNKKHSDSLQQAAKLFIKLYEETYGQYVMLLKDKDSLAKEVRNSEQKYGQLQKLLNGNLPNASSYKSWSDNLQQNSSKESGLTPTEKFLLGIRHFSVGRSTVNYSELTVKNLSLTGVNAEYNSKYYVALAAGSVDYRFTDFIASPVHVPRQYLYVVRLGIGRLEKNYLIVTGYHGQKQLFFGTVNGSQISSISITGFSLATKWQMNRNSYIIGEAAQSFSPDVLAAPEIKSSWSLSDKSNKALSFKLYSYIPETQTKIEGLYKFMGANFQAFNSFQTNAQLVSWYVKADQSLLKKKLHLLVSLRTQDYSNPYIIQDYKANSVLKSISLAYREKGIPSLSAGYMPMSQLTVVGTQIVQNEFQMLNASITHFYKIGLQQVATNLVYTRFFNSSADTGFIYYNSTNFFLTHTLFFKKITAGIAISHSSNNSYRYDVMDENFTFQISKAGTIGGGVKINDLNKQEIEIGEYVTAHIRLGGKDIVNIQADNGFLPGNGNRLVKNFIGTISYTKTF